MTIRQRSPADGSTSVSRRSVLLATGATLALAGCLGSDDGSGAGDAVEEYWQALADDDLESANALVHEDVGERALASPYAVESPVDVTVGATTDVPIEEGAALGAPRFTTEEELDEFRADAGLDDVAFVEITVSVDAPEEDRRYGSIETDGTEHDLLYLVVEDDGSWSVAFSLRTTR